VINALAEQLPELWGGSADLAESNNTTIENGGSFLPASSKMKNANPYGRIIHFGIREHAMGSIVNGITLSGLTKAFGGTFLMFADYMRASVRLAALMDIPSIFVWTHDSIGVGEDGPTHQPIEHFAALRAIPNFNVIRPADANETAACWLEMLKRNKPSGILLSRQNLPVLPANALGVSKGAYAVKPVANPKVSIIATGSEVSVAMKAATQLEADGIATQVVSAPCLEWFSEQDASYRENLLPKSALKVSIEAGVSQGWREYVGDSGVVISLDHFGASASAGKLFEEFGFTGEKVANRIKAAL
jgi:transketolase